MKSPARNALALFLTLFLVLSLAAGAANPDGYHDLAAVHAALDGWAAHPNVEVLELGRSAGDRPIRVLRIAGTGNVDPGERPAVFVGANVAGYHNAGTEAALAFAEHLVDGLDGDGGPAEVMAAATFYVAPALNPDAHDTLFGKVQYRRGGDASELDHDRDGLVDEDGFNDLDGDGRITWMRVPDPEGSWLPHPEDGRVMIRQDAEKGRVGSYRLLREGHDDDGDGESNEDPDEGVVVDHNFPHAFDGEPASGPWPGSTPNAKALFDFFFARPQIALAVVYGPANNLLALPESLTGGGDLGSQKFKVPARFAEFMGLEAETEYTIDEVWDAAKDLSFVRNNNIDKDQLAQFLGAGPATKVLDDDRGVLERWAKDYKKRLEEAGLDKERDGEQYTKGGFTPWIYFQFGAMALELDVWGIPKPKKEKKEGEDEGEKKLTLETLESMSADEFLAFGEEAIAAFMKETGVPAQFTPAMVIAGVQGGRMTPEQMAKMIKSRGGGGGDDGEEGGDEDDPKTKRQREILAWLDENVPGSVAPWTAVTLPSGETAEVGGLDPLVEITPPREMLDAAIAVHTQTILAMAQDIARLEIVDVRAEALGGGVYRVEALGRNNGTLASHTKMAEKGRYRLPVRLTLEGSTMVTGQRMTTSERLEGMTGTISGTWLVRAKEGTDVTVRLLSEHAGNDSKTITLGQ